MWRRKSSRLREAHRAQVSISDNPSQGDGSAPNARPAFAPGDLATKRAQPLPSLGDAERRAALARTIEREVLPRVLISLALPSRAAPLPDVSSPEPQPREVAEFARLLVAHENLGAIAFVQAIRQRGAPSESVCVQLLAPAARALGELWEQDQCSLRQLNLGFRRLLSLLQQVRRSHH